jgi:capsular exopolysaccharide synthesis family protein
MALALGLILAPAAGATAWLVLSAKYTAFAQLHMASVPPWVSKPNADTPEGRNEFSTFQKTQAQRIKSRLVLLPALARDEVKRLSIVRAQADPPAWLEEELKVEFQDGNEIMTVSLSGTNSAELVTLVQAVVKSYEEQVVNAERDRRSERVKNLDKLYAETDKQLRQDNEEIKKLAQTHSTSDKEVLTQQQIGLTIDLAEVKKQLSQTRSERMTAERRLLSLKAQEKAMHEQPELPEPEIAAALDADPEAKSHKLKIDKIHELLKEYESTPNEETPKLARNRLQDEEKALAKRRDALQAELKKRVRSRVQNEYDAALTVAQTEVASLSAQEKALEKEAGELASLAKEKGTSSTELDMLRAKIDREKKHADKLWDDAEILRNELKSPPRVTLLQEAALQKTDMKRQIMGAIAAPIAVLALIALAVAWLEFRARRIRNSEEVVAGLGLRVVGAVPHLAKQTDAEAQANAVESIDAIRTLLLHDASVESAQVVMVTSAVGGEGKTTLSCSLADSLARAGRKTLLLDCDLRRPAVHQMFELPLQPGFSEILLGEIDAADAVQQTQVPGLSVVTAGQWDREVLRALAGEATQSIFEKLKMEFDFIVIDSHPVLAATDSLLLGQHVDAVLVSVLRDVSRSPRVYGACQRLATLGVRVLGVVVNGAAANDVYTHGVPQAALATR